RSSRTIVATPEKVDLKKTLDAYQAERNEFRIVDVPTMKYLMIDGHGDPNTSPEYAAAVAALFPVAYALKFASKRELGRDYVVMPRSEEHTSELQSRQNLVCRLLL